MQEQKPLNKDARTHPESPPGTDRERLKFWVRMGILPQISQNNPGNTNVFLHKHLTGQGSSLHIWVDADACPRAIKEILYRSADRTRTLLTLIANSSLFAPRSAFISTIRVSAGSDMADMAIVEKVQEGDLVISADIILADAVIQKGGTVLSPRGDEFTADNIGEYLSTRTFMSELRSAGIQTGGPPTLTNADKERFANRLETTLRRLNLPQKIGKAPS